LSSSSDTSVADKVGVWLWASYKQTLEWLGKLCAQEQYADEHVVIRVSNIRLFLKIECLLYALPS
jgi:hypothetical protein